MRFRSLTFVQNPSRNLYAPLLSVLLFKRAFHFSFCGTLCIGISLIVKLFASAKTDLHFGPFTLEVYGKRNQSIAFLTHLAKEAHDLFFVHQKLACAVGIAVEDVTLLVRTDMHAEDQQFAVVYSAKGILEVDCTLSERFYFLEISTKSATIKSLVSTMPTIVCAL